MTDKYRVTMDSAVEKALFVHMPEKIVVFKQLENNLYGMDPEDPTSYITKGKYHSKNIQMMNIVEDNLNMMSERQQRKAKMARKAFQAIGTPTTQDFKAMIRMNLIKNLKVTTADINLAEKAFGPDVGEIKGKTTRSKSKVAESNVIELPPELISIHEEVILSIDGLAVNTLKFLTTITHEILYRTGQYIKNARAENYETCMDQIYYIYKRGGFTIVEIHCDNEFRKAMDKFAAKQNPPIRMNYANAQEHVPRAERNNRTIQERVRCAYYQMPYNHLPRTIVKYMVCEAARKLNYFPNKNGVSKHYSPRMILHQENLDFDRHCTYVLGEFVQSHEDEEIKNNNKPRTLDCIYLRPTDSHQGGHELLHIATNKVITRSRVTPVPITPAVIKLIHAIAKEENMPKGLKIENRTNTVLFDAAWTAGVKFDEKVFDEDKEDTDYESDSSEESEEQEYDEMDENEVADIMEEQYVIQLKENEDQNVNNNTEDDLIDQQEDNEPVEEEEIGRDTTEEGDADSITAEQEQEHEHDDEEIAGVRRSQRVGNVPTRLGTYYQHLHNEVNEKNTEEYNDMTAKVIAQIMCHYSPSNTKKMSKKTFYQLVQTYTLKKGIKKFGIKAKRAAYKEMKQLHDRVVFQPIKVEDLTEQERKRAMESLIFLIEKEMVK